jgi:hypothetical protein
MKLEFQYVISEMLLAPVAAKSTVNRTEFVLQANRTKDFNLIYLL